jgi:8-oxo-dGTP pyrophosphatase MutT (NUDIX family)
MYYLMSTTPFEDFNPTIEAAGCYCEFEDKILMVRRHPQKFQGGTWGIPGGKLDLEETARQAVIRECWEEVAVKVDDQILVHLETVYMRFDSHDAIYHMFYHRFFEVPIVTLSLSEHTEARWVTIPEALQLNLIAGGEESIELYLKIKAARGHR